MIDAGRTLAAIATVVAFTGPAACGEVSRDSGGGQARDSAGTRVIELPEPEETPERVLALDTTWSARPALELGDLSDVDVTPNGGVLLLDRLAAQVIRLDAEGAVTARFGRAGAGPGEFDPRGLSVLVVTDSSVLVPDLFQQRVTELSLASGDLLGTRPYPESGSYAVDWRRHPEGGLAYRVLAESGDRLLRWDGAELDTLLTLPPEGAEPNTLLPPVPLWDITAGGDLVVGSSASSSVERRRGATGEIVWISRHRETPPPLSDQGRSHLEDVLVASVEQRSGAAVPREARAQLLAQMTFPERSPVLADLRIAPDGRIWVRRARPVEDMDREALRVGSAAGFGGEHWEILNADGRLEARVRMPRRFVPRAFHGSWLYGILTDELGVQHPARVGSGVLGP